MVLTYDRFRLSGLEIHPASFRHSLHDIRIELWKQQERYCVMIHTGGLVCSRHDDLV